MRITIAAVGRSRSGPVRDLFDRYAGRCPWRIDLVEVPLASGGEAARRRALEGGRLADALADIRIRIVLDEGGQSLSSEAFAARLTGWRDDGEQRLGFQIGGPDGVDPVLTRRADLVLAFGRMTWPHQLVRTMLAEQLYRAASILAGHPYHRS